MLDVVRIAGEDGVSVSNQKREGRIRDVVGARISEQQTAAAGAQWIERQLEKARKRFGESRLTCWIAPYLGDTRGRGDGLRAVPRSGRDERTNSAVPPVERDQCAGVEDEGSHACASLSSCSV